MKRAKKGFIERLLGPKSKSVSPRKSNVDMDSVFAVLKRETDLAYAQLREVPEFWLMSEQRRQELMSGLVKVRMMGGADV